MWPNRPLKPGRPSKLGDVLMFQAKTILREYLRKLSASRTGGVLIYIAFGLPILLGAMALSVDLGRAFILNTELKDFSDAAALAGLNGLITAVTIWR